MTAATKRRAGLDVRLAALDEVVELATGRLDPAVVAAAAAVAGRAGERLRLSAEHTVVALAGSTGSGKSSLFNALAGVQLSEPGMLRPTTAHAHAAVWAADVGDSAVTAPRAAATTPTSAGDGRGGEPGGSGRGGDGDGRDAGPLLDWLDVPRRHLAAPAADGATGRDGRFGGLVLLDLPDVDSVRLQHRMEVDRLIERVDLLVWVVDPQKYADAAVHHGYLVPMATHAAVTLVVLNQADRLDAAGRETCLADLRGLLRRERLGAAPVLAVSARTGEGLDALRDAIAERVAARQAAVQRIEADLCAVAASLDGTGSGARPGTGHGSGARSAAGRRRDTPAAVPRADREALVAALTDAAGAEVVTAAVHRAHRAQARLATGWPFTRWLVRLRPNRLRRLHLPTEPNELVRTALPGPSGVQRARIDTAVRALCDHVTADLPHPWPAVVRRAATASRDELPDLLDRAVAGTDLGLGRRPRWWTVARAGQTLFAAAALVGAGWLLVLAALAWLQLPEPPLPRVGDAPVPTLLLGGGVLSGWLLALLSGRFAAVGARRRAARARRRIGARVRQVADDAVLTPVAEELSVHTRLRGALGRLTG